MSRSVCQASGGTQQGDAPCKGVNWELGNCMSRSVCQASDAMALSACKGVNPHAGTEQAGKHKKP